MKRILVTLLIMLFVYPMMGAVLKGTVKDVSGNPIGGATIVIDENLIRELKSTEANEQGLFKIFVSDGEHEVAIKKIGYETIRERIKISGIKRKDFILKKINISIEDNSISLYQGNNSISSKKQNNQSSSFDSDGYSIETDKEKTQEVDLTRGLVAYYPFEGNSNDMSGNGNNGFVQGATLTSGHIGQCYHFGGFDNSQIIRIPNSNSLKFSYAASFSFWFKLDNYYGMDGWGRKANFGRMIFFAKNFDRGQINSGINGIDSNSFRVDICNNSVGCDATINGTAINVWHHAVMIVTTNWFKIYIDGKEVASKHQDINFNASNSYDLIIGRLAQTWYPFHGCIDEFFVYNRVLSDSEVAALYRGEKNNVSQPPQIANTTLSNNSDYASNSNASNNTSNNTQNENNTQLVVNNKSTSKEVNLTNGLVAYFPFDGNTDDMSGNRNNGRVSEFYRNPFYLFVIPEFKFETGHKGQCGHFPNPQLNGWRDGYEYKNPFINIRVPNSNSLKFNDAVSFSFWFKLEDDGKGRYYGMNGGVVVNSGFVKFFSKVSENGQIHAGIDLGKHCIEVYNNNESCSAPFQLDTKWNHAVMVVTKGYFKIYLNGKEVASKNKYMNFDDSNKCDLYIGCVPNLQRRVNKYAYNGWIDEFLIYNRELTGAEVDALFKGEEPDQNYLAYKRAMVASLKDAIDYLKSCTNDNYRKGVEDEIVNSKTNKVADIAYCNDNYPKLIDKLEGKTFGLINSVSDCETYLKYYSASKREAAIEDKMFGLINSVPDCNTYLKHYSASKRGAALDDKMYQYVNASANINDCETYLKLFPKGKHRSAVVAQKNEIASYNAAQNGGKAECNAYLQKYPNGRFAWEVEVIIAKITAAEEYEAERPIVNENNIMNYVKSMESEKYYDDQYYYVYFKEGDPWRGTIKLSRFGDWEWDTGHNVDGLFSDFRKASPNTKLGALVNLYNELQRKYD